LFDARRPDALAHPGTFNNNTLAMAAGTAAVSNLLTAEALERLNQRGDRLREAILALFRSAAVPLTVTGLGSLLNIQATVPGEWVADLRRLLFFELVAAGCYLAARGLIALSFPITDADTSQLLLALRAFLEKTAHMGLAEAAFTRL
jgi:glutamate-1-semialdehyde 2,1-aminomutase